MMPIKYSQSKFPPAPILKVKMSAPRESAREEQLPAFIDTGADFTLVPLSWLLRIDAPNVLNQMILLLDGPQEQTDVLNRRPLRF